MALINENFLKLPESYLFSDIKKKVEAFKHLHPDANIISLGIGDVTRPIAPVVIEALHAAVDEMGDSKTFRGYGPEQGYDFLQKKIIEMYDEYMMSELIPGIDRFEGIRDFEKLEKLSFEDWINDLEKNKGILDIFIANQIPDELISSQLGFVPQEILKNYSWITVGHTNTSPSTETIIPKSSLENLTQKELQDLDKILHDSYGMKLCPSGLAMLYVSNKKGQLSKWIDINKNHISSIKGLERRFNFSIYKHPEMIADWTPDDFREVINVGNAVKYARLKTLIDVIAQPEKYINPDSGNTYCDDILGISKAKEVGRVDR